MRVAQFNSISSCELLLLTWRLSAPLWAFYLLTHVCGFSSSNRFFVHALSSFYFQTYVLCNSQNGMLGFVQVLNHPGHSYPRLDLCFLKDLSPSLQKTSSTEEVFFCLYSWSLRLLLTLTSAASVLWWAPSPKQFVLNRCSKRKVRSSPVFS